MINKVKGNMYDWITHTWNTCKGKCPHGCHYCYMKKWGEQPTLHFDEKELKADLGKGNFIFVGSSCDIFAKEIPEQWIIDTLAHCNKFKNQYLFQSKNPERVWEWRHNLPSEKIIGTTIESNRRFKEMDVSPHPTNRANAMEKLSRLYKTVVTIEPIMDFDMAVLVSLIDTCSPTWVNVGANTNHKVKLTEPSPDKIMCLLDKLRNITEVKVKPNLKRLMF